VEPSETHRETQIEEILSLMRGVTRGALGRTLSGAGSTGDGFPLLQHFALHYIMHGRRGVTQTELAALLGVSPGYVTTLVDRLEQDHLVRRARDRKDRRVIRLSVTLKGHHFHHSLHRQFDLTAIPLFNGWTDEEIATFERLLRKCLPEAARHGREPGTRRGRGRPASEA
jgi:DNA-binding MarR family transcriptional regulator